MLIKNGLIMNPRTNESKVADIRVENGLIKEGQFTNYDRNIMRYEMAQMFADAGATYPWDKDNSTGSIASIENPATEIMIGRNDSFS